MNDVKNQLENKNRHLLDLQFQILKYLSKDEMKDDIPLDAFFNTEEAPQSAFVYSPYVILLDREIKQQLNEIKDMQAKLKNLNPNISDGQNKIELQPITAEENQNFMELEQLNQEVENLSEELLRNQKDSLEDQAFARQLDIMNLQINALEAQVKKEKDKNDQLTILNTEYKDEICESENLLDVLQERLSKKNELLEQQQIRIDKTSILLKALSSSPDTLFKKNQNLKDLYNVLKPTYEENLKKLQILKDENESYQLLCKSHEQISNQIQDSELHQKDSLKKLEDAINTSEDVQKEVVEINGDIKRSQYELERIKEMTNNFQKRYLKTIYEYESSAAQYFNPFLTEFSRRCSILEEDNQRLIPCFNSLKQQIEAEKKKIIHVKTINNIMGSKDSVKFVEEVQQKAKNIFENKFKLIQEKNTLLQSIQQINESIKQLLSIDSKNEIHSLQKRAQNLEIEKRKISSQLTKLIIQNQEISYKNTEIQSQIEAIMHVYQQNANFNMQSNNSVIQTLKSENNKLTLNAQSDEDEIKSNLKAYQNEAIQNQDHYHEIKQEMDKKNSDFLVLSKKLQKSILEKEKEKKRIFLENTKAATVLKQTEQQIQLIQNEIKVFEKKKNDLSFVIETLERQILNSEADREITIKDLGIIEDEIRSLHKTQESNYNNLIVTPP